HQRHVVCVERFDHSGAGTEYHGVLPDSGAASRDRVLASAFGRRPVTARPHHVSRPDQRLRPQARYQMRPRLAGAILLLLGWPGLAHRLDEYLQGTIITVERNTLKAALTLTPGVAVFPLLMPEIDTDADGVISAREQRAYADRVLQDLALKIDGS